MAELHPSLKQSGCSFDPILKLLGSSRSDDGWNNKLRASLGSVIANRQYPQTRCFQAGWVSHPKCIFCLHSTVSGTQLMAMMPDDAVACGRGRRSVRNGAPVGDQCTSLEQRPTSGPRTLAQCEGLMPVMVHLSGEQQPRRDGDVVSETTNAQHLPATQTSTSAQSPVQGGGLILDTVRDSRQQSTCGVDGVEADPGSPSPQRQQRQQQGPPVPPPLHETATAQQIEDTPAGTMAHRNYACPALKAERALHAPDALLQRAGRFAAGNLAFERGLHPSLNHTVRPPAVDATFTWHVIPPNGLFRGRVYSDGSRLDGPTALLARNGGAFVVLNEADEIIASASGIPPDWVDDIPLGPRRGR